MRNSYLKCSILALIICFSSSIFSQQKRGLWTEASVSKIDSKNLLPRKSEPYKSIFYQLNIEGLKSQLIDAPNRKQSSGVSNVIIDFPMADGSFESFRIKEASVLHEDLQAQFPEIRSYVGESVENPGSLIRFSITPQGLNTMILSSKGNTQYIDPYIYSGNIYMVYSKKDLPVIEGFTCELEEELTHNNRNGETDSQTLNANDGLLREYRLALASTIEYSEFQWMTAGLTAGDSEAAKKAAVLAAMVVTMTRVNGIYENDLSVTMTLVPNNIDVIYINSDSFNNNNATILINQSQSIITSVIGSANYDIGHTFSTGGGGLAGLGVVCNTSNKARGITGSPAPVGDAYDIDYVAHEMGHQFGAPHTFNGNTGSCSGNRESSNAYEPGSGSTIMAYAGICTGQNVQSNSDDYFHQKSLQMMWSYITASATCASTTSTGNSVPTADAGANYTIPKSTPYKLTGSSTDVDGISSHTYTWEEYDLGPSGLPTETTISGPLVRSYKGTTDPTRFIPRLQDLYVTEGSTDWEKLSSVARNLNFRLTVRDNDADGGQTAVDNMMATVSASAGPFIVTSQNTDEIVWTPNTTETVTWNVAGTTGNGVNTANVNILLSTDGGLTYGTILAANTPNDGSHSFTVPNVTAPYCRIMVEAVGNIFFNVNSKNIAVGNYTYQTQDVCQDYEFDLNAEITESSDNNYPGMILNIEDSFTISDINVYADVTHPNIGQFNLLFWFPWSTSLNTAIWFGQTSCTNADMDKWFDTDGVTANCSTNGGDAFIPYSASNFDGAIGQNSDGEWRIYFKDAVVDGSGGIFNTFTIQLCGEQIVPVLSTDTFNLENTLSVYPNPNNGNFTVKFRPSSSNVSLEVFDIRGRQVFTNTYTPNGAFSETIQLNNVQSGMYILNINDGGNKVTKKIIVN